jgi:hypothetical protein
MVLFSERNGLAPEKILQDKDFDVISRRLLAHEIIKLFEISRDNHEALKGLDSFRDDLVEYGITHAYWRHLDEAENQLFFYVRVYEYRRADFKLSIQACTTFLERLEWWQVLDIVEMLIENMGRDVLKDFFNGVFEELCWAYKVTCDGQIIPTMDDICFDSLEKTLTLPVKYEGVKTFVANAVSLYKHRPERKYIEACMGMSDALDKLAKIITKDNSATIQSWFISHKGDLPVQIHSKADRIYALRGGFISHGNGDENEIDASFAKWYLVSCSALINWMIEKYA